MQEPTKPAGTRSREEVEADLVFGRAIELELNPVAGKFDSAHLREINRRLFQDMPDAGFPDVTPGKYRPPVPAGQDWIKNRVLDSLPNHTFYVAYSSMDRTAQDRLDQVLKNGADPKKLAKLETKDFTQAIGSLYAELDYVHPFSDGNSRTLRTFTRQLAKEAGYDLDWERFGRTQGGRDVLYIARDLSVNELAEPHLQDHNTRIATETSRMQLGKQRTLPDLLKDAIRPLRAIAFEREPEADAVQKYPELGEAYKTLHAAEQYFQKVASADPDTRTKAFGVAKAKIVEHLNAGKTSGFSKLRETPAQPEPEPRSPGHARSTGDPDR